MFRQLVWLTTPKKFCTKEIGFGLVLEWAEKKEGGHGQCHISQNWAKAFAGNAHFSNIGHGH